jgi:pyruvate kinase
MQNNFNGKLTKIVATIGPATETEEALSQIVKAGVDVARFNTKHGTPEWHHERILKVRKVEQQLGKPVGILLDLQGPEIRINLPDEGSIKMEPGETAFFATEPIDKPNLVLVPRNVLDVIEPGQLLLIDDGFCQFEAIEKDNNFIEVKALDKFIVKHRKSMSIPGVVTDMPVLVENDYVQLDGIQDDIVDYVALSFVRNKQDILGLRQELDKRNLTAGIIAKIENQAALDNLQEIISVSDGVMIARGDLGVEVPYEELIYWQRRMIQVCREQAKPVITATHMLETMIDQPLPTRAEISDVAHAIYDLTDAVMLSGETTIGKYPVRAVETQAKIAQFNERFTEIEIKDCSIPNDESNIAHAASHLITSQPTEIEAVVCLTETGHTASLIARNRPNMPVHVVTGSDKVYHQLTLHYGLIPHKVDWPREEELLNATNLLNKMGQVPWLKSGQRVLVLHGPEWRKPGETNTLSIVTVE